MHTISCLLVLYTILLGFTQGLAAPELAESTSNLAYGLFSPKEYEILSVRDDGDEDVIYLRKRADENCETDCLNYSGWEDDERMHCDEDDADEDDVPDKDVPSAEKRSDASKPGNRVAMEKRGQKDPMLVCEGIKVDGIDQPGFYLYAPGWPKPGTLTEVGNPLSTFYNAHTNFMKKYKRVYDTGDPREPVKKEWFVLEKRAKQWPHDLDGRSEKRCYAAEHVLEWQMLKDFIEEDRHGESKDEEDNDEGSTDDESTDDESTNEESTNEESTDEESTDEEDKDEKESRCVHLYRWFLKDMPAGKSHKVKVAKGKGELKNDRFEMEDLDFTISSWSKTGTNVQSRPRFIEWISLQWPGSGRGKVKSPWEYELAVLNQEANIKKENVWAKKNIFVKPKLIQGTNKMKPVETNSNTLEALAVNTYYKDETSKTWDDNKGACKAIYRFMTMMAICQYHSQPFIKEVLRTQVKRVGEAWELVEKEYLAHETDAAGVKYKHRGLKEEWLDFMVTRHKVVMKRLKKALDAKLGVFDNNAKYTTKIKRWDYKGIFRRVVEVPNCGFEKDGENIKKRFKLLKDAYESMGPVEEDLKLD